MTFFSFLRKRLDNIHSSSPPIPSASGGALEKTPSLRRHRKIHRQTPSGTSDPSDPPFVRRRSSSSQKRNRSTSLSSTTPPEITDSVSNAKTCSAYLRGQAMSVLVLTTPRAEGGEEEEGISIPLSEAFQTAKGNLLAEFDVFERDQVQWAGYLVEGSEFDRDDPERTRLFVLEGREIMKAVADARVEVDRVCAL